MVCRRYAFVSRPQDPLRRVTKDFIFRAGGEELGIKVNLHTPRYILHVFAKETCRAIGMENYMFPDCSGDAESWLAKERLPQYGRRDGDLRQWSGMARSMHGEMCCRMLLRL